MSTASKRAAAFTVYLELGPQRSLVRLRETIAADHDRFGFGRPPSLRTLETWSGREGWPARVTEIERKARIAEEEEHVGRVREYRQRLRQEGLLLQQKGVTWLSAMDINDVRPSEAIRAISEGFRLEALAIGEATERVSVSNENPEFMEKLTDDELAQLVALLRAAPAGAPGALPAEA